MEACKIELNYLNWQTCRI